MTQPTDDRNEEPSNDEILAQEPDHHALAFEVGQPEILDEEPGARKASSRVRFRGGVTCECVATSLPIVEKVMIERGLIKYNIDVYQLGYRGDVSASAGTHSGGGNTDVGQFSDAHIRVWREMGWTMQHRSRAQGFDMAHGHGWPFGCPHLSPGGRSQNSQWKNRTNGLVSRGRIAGLWPVPGWKVPVAAYKKRIAAKDKRDDAAQEKAERAQDLRVQQVQKIAATKAKELELPTVNEVWNADIIGAPDDAPDKKTNTHWKPASYLWHMFNRVTQILASNKRIESKLDTLIAKADPPK